MLTIKILGPGCANCKRLEEIARKSAADLGVEAEFVKVTDYQDILAYNVLSTPGRGANETLASAARIRAPAAGPGWPADALTAA